MFQKPIISVVVPVHNSQASLKREIELLLDALFDLTAQPCEVLLIDDGSRDATPEVVDELMRQYPQVRSIRHPRRLGSEAAGNTGIQNARGEIVIVQENEQPVGSIALRRLFSLVDDKTILAARAEARRDDSGRRIDTTHHTESRTERPPAVQMIRRPSATAGKRSAVRHEKVVG
ncbi:MAG: glycosyltransferase family 2 protein [Planctomycetota bacterium]